MTITPTAAPPATSLYTTTTQAAAPKQDMDKEVFLSLLVAQLRNQDPTAPMDTGEMMAQSTQLASMEQLSAMADTSRESFSLQMRIAAGTLVGQQVSFLDETGVRRTGVASDVSFDLAVPIITVGEWTVPLDAVSTVSAPRPPSTGTTDPGTDPTPVPPGSAGTSA